MIEIANLLWIVPSSMMFGFLIASLVSTANCETDDNDEYKTE